MERETLLPIHREFTDKEKLEWMKSEYRVLEERYRGVVEENKSLIRKNKKLVERVKADEAEFPSKINGLDCIKPKTFLKLRKHCKVMTDRFWEVNDELLKLKQQIEQEKL